MIHTKVIGVASKIASTMLRIFAAAARLSMALEVCLQQIEQPASSSAESRSLRDCTFWAGGADR
jgi:hypothetical protein